MFYSDTAAKRAHVTSRSPSSVWPREQRLTETRRTRASLVDLCLNCIIEQNCRLAGPAMENLPLQLKEKFLSRLDGRMQGEAVLRYFVPEDDQDVKHMNLSWLEELHMTPPLVWSFEPYFEMLKRLPRLDSLMIPANTRLALIRLMPKTIKRLELIMPIEYIFQGTWYITSVAAQFPEVETLTIWDPNLQLIALLLDLDWQCSWLRLRSIHLMVLATPLTDLGVPIYQTTPWQGALSDCISKLEQQANLRRSPNQHLSFIFGRQERRK